MTKKIFLFLSSLFLINYSNAETCPTPVDLHNANLKNWQVLNIDNGTYLSPAQTTQFEKNVAHFALAEWMEDAPEGEAHCYYEGLQQDSSYLGVFLAKHSLHFDKKTSVWQDHSGTMQCTAGILQCQFIS